MTTNNSLKQYLAANPFELFAEWFAAGEQSEPINANAITLATIAADNMPQARTVLLKGHSPHGFVFYTNTESRKGRALQNTAKAAILFYWRALGRQFSAEGEITQLSAAETEPYYRSRPRGSQIGAWASAQSRPLASYDDLRAVVAAKEEEFAGRTPPLPPHWRGYCLQPRRMEFWQEGEFRLHQRLEFARNGEAGDWRARLLQP